MENRFTSNIDKSITDLMIPENWIHGLEDSNSDQLESFCLFQEKQKEQFFEESENAHDQHHTSNIQKQVDDVLLMGFLQTEDSPSFQQQDKGKRTKQNLKREAIQKLNSAKQLKRQHKNSSIYSKNYRQKQKEKMKILEQENYFLKKKIDDLQNRLRQKQLELNRLKWYSNDQQFTIHQINEQIMKKLTLISQDQSKDEIKHNKQSQNVCNYINQQKVFEFAKFYQDHGFGGKKKKEILQYYFNEFLENIMRDREKYHFLDCVKRKYYKGQKTPMDLDYEQVWNQSEQDRSKRLQYQIYMRPICMDLLTACRQFYQGYQKVINKIQIIHQQMKIAWSADIQQLKLKARLSTWFQTNQYRKEMRNLRAQWVDLVKNLEQLDEQKKEKPKKKICK